MKTAEEYKASFMQKSKEAQRRTSQPTITSWGHIIRPPSLELHRKRFPELTRTSDELLKRFYKIAGVKPLGKKTIKFPWFLDQDTFHLFVFCDSFSVRVTLNRDTENHLVSLHYKSDFNKVDYWFASAPAQFCNIVKFWRIEQWQPIMQRLIYSRKFTINTLHEESDIPIY